MNLINLSNLKKKRSNAPGNGVLNQVKKSRNSLYNGECLKLEESIFFQSDEEVMADIITKYSNCCSSNRSCLIGLFKRSDHSVDWTSLLVLYRACVNEFRGMSQVEKEVFHFKKFQESVINTSKYGPLLDV